MWEENPPVQDPPTWTERKNWNGVIPVIRAIRELPESEGILISVDTRKSAVAEKALEAGADISMTFQLSGMIPG